MEFWLSFNNFAESSQLPIPPSEYSTVSTNLNETVNIAGLGDINLIGGAGLTEIEITSFFPSKPAQYGIVSAPEPFTAIALIEKWKKSLKPIRLIITTTPINMACAIESFTWGERGGTRNIDYTLSLKEYRFIEVKQVNATEAAAGASARPDTKETASSHTVKSGDTLFLIAKKVLGDGNKWREIYEKNADTIGSNPNLIIAGQVLRL